MTTADYDKEKFFMTGKAVRIATLDAIEAAELDLYYCLEPIGAEHRYEELADEMIRAKEYGVDVMAVMRRVNVPGTAFENKGDYRIGNYKNRSGNKNCS